MGWKTFALSIASAAFVLASCSSDSTSEDPAETSYTPTSGKEWVVDTSGWWLPEDPTGCLNETTTCPMSAWPSREYKQGQVAANVFRHGDTLTLFCKAPTPLAIRNSLKNESVYWYYSQQADNIWWVPDIYVTNDDTSGMAEGVPDCPSNTPGINGGTAEQVGTGEGAAAA